MAPIDQSKLTRFNAYVETLPAQQRGVLILALWANAVLSVALDGAWLVLVIRAHQRAKSSPHRMQMALDVARSRSTAVVIAASVIHRIARHYSWRQLDRRAGQR